MKYVPAAEPSSLTRAQTWQAKRQGLKLSARAVAAWERLERGETIGYYSFSKAIKEIEGKPQDIVSRGGGRNFYYISLSRSCKKLISIIRELQLEVPQRENAKELRIMWGKELQKYWRKELMYKARYWHLGWVELPAEGKNRSEGCNK